jgi:hypothetical protein
MKRQLRVPFANLKFENWQNLVLVAVFIFYLFQAGFWVFNDRFLQGYGVDYLAFWSAGKIADEKGYAEIYSIENLRTVQTQELETQGLLEKGEGTTINPFPAPYFSFFVIPFQFLSRVNPKLSYWLWTSINLLVLIGYLIFFLRKTQPENSHLSSNKRIILLMLLSFPVALNLAEGQLEVFLLVCTGEFIRYALNKKSLPSGLWLGGLLLKPQLLIIIIPVLLILKNLKVLMGFFASSGVIFGSSLIISGFKGMKSLIALWTQYSAGIATNSPQAMINWRMIAVNLNSPLGWIIAIMGMALSLTAVYFLVKNKDAFGTSRWVMIMLGVFSATLAITWHSHYHMAVVLIPFLIYCSMSQMLNEKVVFFWATGTPLMLIALMIITLFVYFLAKFDINYISSFLPRYSGFLFNLVIIFSTLRFFHMKKETSNLPDSGNAST